MARVIDHIPEPSQQTVRYWGYYAKAIRESLELPAQEPEPLAHAPPEKLELIAASA